jgi:TonB family protein
MAAMTIHRYTARLFLSELILAALSLACAGPAGAQVGPIEPIIVSGGKPSATLASMPEIGADLVIPVEVTVAADGSVSDVVVSTPSGNESADVTAIRFMKEKRFLPALDERAQPVEGKASGTVEILAKTRTKQLKASMKPPNIPSEVARVRKLTCKDFLWEIDRLRNAAASPDVSREIMPWVSLRVYMLDRHLPKDAEPAYLRKWPQALSEAETSCKATPTKLYLADTLMLILDSLAPNK